MTAPIRRTKVAIVGAGIAGLYAALSFSDSVDIIIICKGEQNLCNSSLAQGGVAAVLDGENDSFEHHIEDTLKAGKYENDLMAVRTLVEEGPDDIRRLIEWGCNFDRSPDGELQMTLEGGHSRRRIVHHLDSTGEEMTSTLLRKALSRPNIKIISNTFVYDIMCLQGGFLLRCGTEKIKNQPEELNIAADYCLLATGGIGRVYKYTTNSAIATGDGIALAMRLGAQIKHLDYVQFHPTAFASSAGRERFLISEAVRGEGAWLLNCEKQRFMHKYDERLELAPRDVVSRAMILESRRTGSEKFYLDISRKSADFIKARFPVISSRCLLEGADMTRGPIPVYPCQHYLMGGIDVDLFGRTRIDRLYAIGECSHTGVHGKNRLASNSLLEAVVFSRRAAEHIEAIGEYGRLPENIEVPPMRDGPPMPAGFRTSIREIMQECVFVLPDHDAAQRNLGAIKQINRRLGNNKFKMTRDYSEARALGTIAATILESVNERL